MQMKLTVPPSGGDAADTHSRNGHHSFEVYGPSGRSEWLDVDWREHQRWVSVNGEPVNTIDLGEGPPVVFVHGLTGSWPNWLEQLPVFAGRPQSDGSPLARNRVVAMDLPGFGHSPMPREQITISFYARLLDGLLDQLGIDAAAVVGNSMGGFISAELAIAFPQRVERLVLVSPAGISTYGDRREALVPILRRFEPALTGLTAWGANRADAITSRPALRQAVLGDLVRYPGRLPATIAAELVRGAGRPGFMQALAANFDYDFRDRLHEIVCPTLIVWGEDDRIVTVRDAAVYAELIPGSRKVIFGDTGHLAMVERPDAFNALLNEFLEE
jgi:pimeloyl-ACP methyl ester carboxylesterase